MVFYPSILNANQIASHGHFSFLNFYTNTGSFERTPTFKIGSDIITQQTHIGNFASRGKAFRNSGQHATSAIFSQKIHIGGFGCLHGGFPIQLDTWFIGHSITEYNQVFHTYRMLAMLMISAKTPTAVTLAPAP